MRAVTGSFLSALPSLQQSGSTAEVLPSSVVARAPKTRGRGASLVLAFMKACVLAQSNGHLLDPSVLIHRNAAAHDLLRVVAHHDASVATHERDRAAAETLRERLAVLDIADEGTPFTRELAREIPDGHFGAKEARRMNHAAQGSYRHAEGQDRGSMVVTNGRHVFTDGIHRRVDVALDVGRRTLVIDGLASEV